jgi:hypothetical protein
MKGKHHSEDTKRKISESVSGKNHPLYGKHLSGEHKQKIGYGNLGKRYSKKTKQKMSIVKRNEKHPQWKGNDVGYGALHKWISKNKPKPELCEECNKKKLLELANISGEYKRDINDYRWLCRKCHMISDDRIIKNLKHDYRHFHRSVIK